MEMKRNMPSAVLLWIMVILMLPACSVKEDRGDCPGCIIFDFSGVDTDVMDSLYLSLTSADGFLFVDTVCAESFQDRYSVNVPRQGIDVNVNWGTDGLFKDGQGLLIPSGSQCPPVHMFSARLDADCEYCVCRPLPAKNYCRIMLHLVSDDAPAIIFALRVTGNVCGYDIAGQPAGGEFAYIPDLDAEGTCSIRVPRQRDNSLMLEIIEDGQVLRRFALGNIMAESGYDWSARNLEDIELTVNYSKTDVTFVADDWEKEFFFDITI